MAGEIRRVAAIFLAGFFTLTLGLVWWQVVRADRLAHRAGNPRVAELSARTHRGSILAADGSPLARSEPQADGHMRRVYAIPSLAQTLGYVSARYGVTGIEESFDDYLSGDRGGEPADLIWADISREPVQGNDVVTTIVPDVQEAAARAMGDRRGAVVALNPRTGAVLAMVSAPWFDAGGIDELGAGLLKNASQPLLNRATQGQYPPGSTFKTVTASAAIDLGIYKPDDRFTCPSGKVFNGFVIACTGVPPGTRDYDFAHAYTWSINANFAEVAVKLDATNLVKVARRFGFEEDLPFDLPLAESHLLRTGQSFDTVLLANTGFGQGQLSVTPMQMALVAATVANGGVLMDPYLVSEVRTPKGASVYHREPRQRRKVIEPDTAATLRSFMGTAAREGFSSAIAIPGVEVGGKTGTAEIGEGQTPHAWFTGVAPLDNPQIVVAVIVENGGAGSAAAAPVAQAVMRAALGK